MSTQQNTILTIGCLVLAFSSVIQADVIYQCDFRTGNYGPEWQFYNNIGFEDDYIMIDPFWGLTMWSDNGVLNESVVVANLSGFTDTNLVLWYGTQWNTSPQSLPSDFSGHFNGDGISFSLDGVNWHTAFSPYNLTGSLETLELFGFPIPPASTVYIKFQIYCNGFTDWSAVGIQEILISGTPAASVTVPDVVGMTQSSAEAAIVASDLVVGTISQSYSGTVPAGNIISQNPSAGTSASSGSSVNLVVSLGPLPVGSLQVAILPTEAVAAGAQWRRLGTTAWFNSGDTETNIAAGNYKVELKEAAGWNEPPHVSVTISNGQFTQTSATYTPQTAPVVTIGTGTTTWNYPLSTYYHDARTQTIYRASEVGGACTITGLALYVTQVPAQTMNSFTIRLKHTDLIDYSSSPQWQFSDWTIVYQANQSVTATGWIPFEFSQPFFFNGTQSLMVDISFNNTNYTSDGICRYSLLGGSRSIYYRSDSGYGYPLTWSGTSPSPSVSNNAPNIRFYLAEFGNLVTTPDLTGLTQSQAVDTLQAVGLTPGDITGQYSNTVAVGLIASQMPVAGSLLPEGFDVDIVISLGPIYSGGSGTEEYPYLIATAEDLLFLSGRTEDYNKHFKLMANIDLTGEVFAAAVIGADTNMSSGGFQGTSFTGVFDGSGYAINHLAITASSGDYIGLFGYIGNSGQVKNLGLVDIDITGRYIVGGLAGMNNGVLNACHVIGSIGGEYYAGGLCGCNNQGAISDSYTGGTVAGNYSVGGLVGQNNTTCSIISCFSSSAVTGAGQYGNSIGGLCGYNYEGIISDSYAIGAVTGCYYVGGLCGYNLKSYAFYGEIIINRCYATGQVSATGGSVGGLVGLSQSEEQYMDCHMICDLICDEWGNCWENCWEECIPMPMQTDAPWLIGNSFWDYQATEQNNSSGGTGESTELMKVQATFSSNGWDFLNTWAICEETNYPRLAWQILTGDFACPDGVSTEDLDYFVERWLMANCTDDNSYCGGADMDNSEAVNMADLAMFAQHWLEGM